MARRSVAAAAAVLALNALPSPLAAQEPPALVIEHADQIQRLAQGDSISYYLDGNVRARREDLRMTAQHAVLLDWLGLVDLTRDVHLWDADKELYADHVTYTDSADVAVATGNVQVIDRATGSQLHAQQVVYDRPGGVMTATQKPEMVLLPEPDSAVAESPADSVAVDSATAEADSVIPIRVWSEQVQLFTEGERVAATGNVLIRRGDNLTAKADSVLRSGTEDVLRLRGSPRVETDRFYVEGNEVDVLLPDDELEALLARGSARATSVTDSIPPAALAALGNPSANSWLSGDTLRFQLQEETLRSIRAEGSARSLSYALESRAGDAVTWALNYLLAGRIEMEFAEDGEALRRVDAAGKGRGIYRTAALAGADGEPVAPPADSVAGLPPDSVTNDTAPSVVSDTLPILAPPPESPPADTAP